MAKQQAQPRLTESDPRRRRRAREDRRPLPGRLDMRQQILLSEGGKVGGFGITDTMFGTASDCLEAGRCDGLNGSTGPPKFSKLADLLNPVLFKPDVWTRRVKPQYDCQWGDWRYTPACQKLLRTMGADTRTLRRFEDKTIADSRAKYAKYVRSHQRQKSRAAQRVVGRQPVFAQGRPGSGSQPAGQQTYGRDSMLAYVERCERGGKCDGMDGRTGPPHLKKLVTQLAKSRAQPGPLLGKAVLPRYDCRWGDWRFHSGCQKVLGSIGMRQGTRRAPQQRRPPQRRPQQRRSLWTWLLGRRR